MLFPDADTDPLGVQFASLVEEDDVDPSESHTLRRQAPSLATPTRRGPDLPRLNEAHDTGEEGTSTDQTAVTLTPRTDPGRAMLTILTGPEAGKVIVLAPGETLIGRGTNCHVQLDDRGLSRQHCRIRGVRGRRFRIEDLDSTNGTYVDGKRVESAKLNGGERLQFGGDVIVRFSFGDETEEQLAKKLYEASTRDALTKCFIRGVFDERLTSEVAYARRHKAQLGVILFDADHFKSVNDQYGHAAGDEVLRQMASAVQTLVRSEDLVARYGGEEFVILVRGGTRIESLAERARATIEALRIPIDRFTLRITASFGVASLSDISATAPPEAMVRLADERLYTAKAQGRNRVCFA